MPIKNSNKSITVCHVTSAHNRYDVRIFHKECSSLARSGFDVTLLVNDDKEDELIKGVKIKSTHFEAKNRFERMIVSQKKIKKEAKNIDADIYHFHDPELLPLASNLKRNGKKVIFDFHEDVSQQILFKMWIPKIFRKITSNIYRLYESKIVKKFDALISVTPKFVDRLSKVNINTGMVTNYPKLNKDINVVENNMVKSICFAGGVSPQWNHVNIIKTMEHFEDISYLLAGIGSDDYLKSLRALPGWKKVDYLGRIPHEEVKQLYSKSMIGMTLLSHDTQVGNEGTLGNTKIFEFMEAGLPIICSNNNLWENIVNEYKCGIAVDPSNVDEISSAVYKLINDSDLAKEMGRNGRKAVANSFNWQTQEKVLLDMYKNMIKN